MEQTAKNALERRINRETNGEERFRMPNSTFQQRRRTLLNAEQTVNQTAKNALERRIRRFSNGEECPRTLKSRKHER